MIVLKFKYKISLAAAKSVASKTFDSVKEMDDHIYFLIKRGVKAEEVKIEIVTDKV